MKKRDFVWAAAISAVVWGAVQFLRPDPEADLEDLEEKIQTLKDVNKELNSADQVLEYVNRELKRPEPNLEDVLDALGNAKENLEEATTELFKPTTEEELSADNFLPEAFKYAESLAEALPYIDPEEDIYILELAEMLAAEPIGKYINRREFMEIKEDWDRDLKDNLKNLSEIGKEGAFWDEELYDPVVTQKHIILNLMAHGETFCTVIDALLKDEKVFGNEKEYLKETKAYIRETLNGRDGETPSLIELLEEHMKKQEQSQEQGSESSKATFPTTIKVAAAQQVSSQSALSNSI